MIARLAAALLVIPYVSSSSFAQNSIRIEIRSSWAGLGSQPDANLTIISENGQFISNGRKLNRFSVKELLDAMDAPSVEHPSLAACGVDQTWLEENYLQGLKEFTNRKLKELSAQQIDLFKTQFLGQESSERLFERLFQNWHTDDFPKLSVTVRDGTREFGITSDSQYPFMLPWVGVDRARGGFNCKISRAIFALLPKGFANRDRLAVGHELRWQLTEQTMNQIRSQWNFLNAQNLVGTDIVPILASFSLLRSEVSNLSSVDLDGKQSWNAELSSRELPQNLVIGVSLLYRNKHLEGVEDFLRQVPRYSELVLSVPWLDSYLRDHPASTFELRYAGGRSLSPKATQHFEEDLRTHGKLELAQILDRDAMSSAFLEVNGGSGCWSRAVVLPNRDLLLWHFKCDSVLGFPAAQFKVWDYLGWRSTGTVIGLDGSIRE
jgi:hypothetical protein